MKPKIKTDHQGELLNEVLLLNLKIKNATDKISHLQAESHRTFQKSEYFQALRRQREFLEIEIEKLSATEIDMERFNRESILEQDKEIAALVTLYKSEKQNCVNKKLDLQITLKNLEDDLNDSKTFISKSDSDLEGELQDLFKKQKQQKIDHDDKMERLLIQHEYLVCIMKERAEEIIQNIQDRACEKACGEMTLYNRAEVNLNRSLKQRITLMKGFARNLVSSVDELRKRCKSLGSANNADFDIEYLKKVMAEYQIQSGSKLRKSNL